MHSERSDELLAAPTLASPLLVCSTLPSRAAPSMPQPPRVSRCVADTPQRIRHDTECSDRADGSTKPSSGSGRLGVPAVVDPCDEPERRVPLGKGPCHRPETSWSSRPCGAGPLEDVATPARERPARDHPVVRRYAAGLSLGLLAWNNLVHVLPGTAAAYVPLNLAATGAVGCTARRHGLSWADLGLRRDRAAAGVRWGGAVAAVVAGALGVAAAVPALHPLLDDARVRRLSTTGVAYHALVRIPFGTVVLEEVAFRGALFGALSRASGTKRAAVASSAVFGLWHMRPTLGLLDARGVDDPVARAASVVAAVGATAAGGLLFCLLRVRSDSTVAPIVAHLATNSFGVLASAATR